MKSRTKATGQPWQNSYKKNCTRMQSQTRTGANDKPLEIPALVAYAGAQNLQRKK